MDALAFGQITPGPVVITATFIGYRVAGTLGAVLATLGIFAPAFFNILTWFPYAERKIGTSIYSKRFVMWAVAAVAGSIAVAMGRLVVATSGGSHFQLILIATAATLAIALTKLPVWLVIPAGGLLAGLLKMFTF
jgi:chromate transporter